MQESIYLLLSESPEGMTIQQLCDETNSEEWLIELHTKHMIAAGIIAKRENNFYLNQQ